MIEEDTLEGIRAEEATEEEAYVKRCREYLATTSEADVLRFFFDNTKTEVATAIFWDSRILPPEDYRRYYYRAAAARFINERYPRIRQFYLEISMLTLELSALLSDYQGAVTFVAIYEASAKAIGESVRVDREGDTTRAVVTNIGAVNSEYLWYKRLHYLSGSYGEYVHSYGGEDPTEEDIAAILEGKRYTVDTLKVIHSLKGRVDSYRQIARVAKTHVTAIEDTIGALGIKALIDSTLLYQLLRLKEAIANVEKAFSATFGGFEKIEVEAEGATLSQEAKAALSDVKKAFIPYSRTHVFGDKYTELVAGFCGGEKGDNSTGDFALKAVEEYKRNKK